MFEEKDYINNQIWHVQYDDNFDLIYIFQAIISSKDYKAHEDSSLRTESEFESQQKFKFKSIDKNILSDEEK